MQRLGFLLILVLPALASAGLHYSAETPAELPSQWRGFLVDLRALRMIGVPPAPTAPLHLLREQYEDAAGKLEVADKKADPAIRKKLAADDVAMVQQLALWLPSDGRLLWLLGELANQHGDVRTAASILEGVVTEFALTSQEAREHRKFYRAAADEIAKLPDSEHAKYRGDITFKSPRPVTRIIDAAALPAIRPDGINPLPWAVVSETIVGKPFRP